MPKPINTSLSSPDLSVRLAEVLASLSLGIDMAVGQPMEWVLRTTLVAMHLGRSLGLPENSLQNIYDLSMLRHIGCTGTSTSSAAHFGDELGLASGFQLDLGNMSQAFGFMLKTVGKGQGLLRRLMMIGRMLANGQKLMVENSAAHCEIAERLGEKLGLRAETCGLFKQLDERWDGKGNPSRLKGRSIALEVRIVVLAQEAATWHGVGGLELAVKMVQERAGKLLDPEMVGHFSKEANAILGPLESASVWDAALAAEPGPNRLLGWEGLEAAAEAFADFSDLKSPYFMGHSRGVAQLATAASLRCGQSPSDARSLRLAGLLHDAGRVAVSSAIWNKSKPLSPADREAIRLHPYHGERILSRITSMTTVANLSGGHHERGNGKGYPQGLSDSRLSLASRLLAAADVYQALREARPHREAYGEAEAAAELRRDAQSGKLDQEAVEAVLGVAGHKVKPILPAAKGLSDREIEVLRLMARGKSNAEMGRLLYISPKTVGHHVQHIYTKIGVSTRAGAALFAVENHFLEK